MRKNLDRIKLFISDLNNKQFGWAAMSDQCEEEVIFQSCLTCQLSEDQTIAPSEVFSWNLQIYDKAAFTHAIYA